MEAAMTTGVMIAVVTTLAALIVEVINAVIDETQGRLTERKPSASPLVSALQNRYH
jgi:hypothetical protein